MRSWHSLYEILIFPIGVLLLACFFLGIGNLLTNPIYNSFIHFKSDVILLTADSFSRIGSLTISYFPLIFLIRIVARKAGSATSITSALLGYFTYLVFTMYFTRTDLPTTAYSSILGVSVSTSIVSGLSGSVHYPLQTGLLATLLVSLATLNSYNSSRTKSEYGLFSFMSRDVWCVLRTIVLCAIAGVLVAYCWPYVLRIIQTPITFVSSDTANPINLTIYGMMDRVLSVFNLGALIRSPFWYGTNGGSWLSLTGLSVAGDVNIWTNQLSVAAVSGMSGRFITPYYILNIFAIPGMLWAMYTVQTDQLERRRMRLYYVFATLISLMSGSLLPIEITLFLLCPLLYFFHIGYTGILFGVLQSMRVYLGYNYSGTAVVAAMPGTLPELLTYMQNLALRNTLVQIAIVGVISAIVYFLATKVYFNYLALDLFHTGDKDRAINGTIRAVGGIENVKLVHSSMNRLVISLYDPSKLNVRRLKDLGSLRVYETKAGYAVTFGSASTMIRRGIDQKLREYVRTSK